MRNVLFIVFWLISATPTHAHGPLLPPGHGLHGPFPSIHGPLLPPKVAGDPSFVTDCTVLDRDGQIVKGTGVVDFTTESPQGDPGELATATWIEAISPSGNAILDCTGDDSTLQWEPNPGL